MLSWRVITILLLFSTLGHLVPVPGKHFLIETEDEAVDEPDVEVIGKKMENRIFKCTGEGTNCIQDRVNPDDFKCLNGASCERKERSRDTVKHSVSPLHCKIVNDAGSCEEYYE